MYKTLQHVIFPQVKVCTEEAMFFHREDSSDLTIIDDGKLYVNEGKITFDTYFNSFSLHKWKQYTKLKDVSLKLILCGAFGLTVERKYKEKKSIITEVIAKQIVNTDSEETEVIIPCPVSNSNGILAFSLQGLQDGSYIKGGEFFTEIDESELNRVKMCINICTFKREPFIYGNLNLLIDAFFSDPNGYFYDKLDVCVVDNGKTLDKSAIKKKFEESKIKIIPNKNVGGSGGFTRGLMEIISEKDNPYTHALFMDDDIVISPEVIERTLCLLEFLNERYIHANIGGAMLRLDKPYYQTESGACWNAGNLVANKHGLILTQADSVIYNEIEEKAEYNAWWYNVIPLYNIDENNLPLPIFIRGDDVEFGLRNTKQLILMNGICVWHEPFENKYSSTLFYYIFRNRLIVNALHLEHPDEKQFISDFKNQFYRELLYLRYKNAELLLRGAFDFFKGVDWLLSQDGEKLNKEIMSSGYAMKEIQNLDAPFNFPAYENRLKYNYASKLGRLKNLITFNGQLLPPKTNLAIVPTVGVRPIQLYRVKTALYYDENAQKGFECPKDKKALFRLLRKFGKLKKLSKKKFDAVNKEYRERVSEYTSMEFWKKYLSEE